MSVVRNLLASIEKQCANCTSISCNFCLIFLPPAHPLTHNACKYHPTISTQLSPTANKYNDAVISIPEATEPGDMLVIYIGGSHAGKLIPSSPIPRAGWEEIIDIGPSDLNLKAFYKPYESYNDNDTYKVTDGKSAFVSIVAIRGLNKRRPVVDSGADKDVVSGREGGARAPSVETEDDGLILASYVYDDPQVAKVMGRHEFDMILSTDTRSGDGMAIGVKSTREGESGYIYAEGQWQPGGGNEIGMAISFRSAGDDEDVRSDVAAEYYSGASAPPEDDMNDEAQIVPDTPRPTKRPTKRPTSTKSPTRSPTTRRPSTSSPTASPSKPPVTQNPTHNPTRRPSPSLTEDVVDLLRQEPTEEEEPETTTVIGHGASDIRSDDGVDSFDSPIFVQPKEISSLLEEKEPVPSNTSDNTTPLLIGVIVGLLIFSTVVIAAAIKYKRDVSQNTQSTQPSMPSEAVASSKRGPPVRSDTYLSDTSLSEEDEYGPPRSESWLSFQSDVDSDLSAIEEGKIVCDPLPRSTSNVSRLSAGEREGFAEFIQPSTSFPPPPPPPL